MEKVRSVGLDVHERSITIAIADADGAAPAVLRRIPHNVHEVITTLKGLQHSGATVKVAYEAGPCGVGLSRSLESAGFECIVVAPSKTPSTGRPKNDGEDAMRLARFLRSGDLVRVHVHDVETEALRALTRSREDAIEAQQRARAQMRNFLVSEGRRFNEATAWTKKHIQWINNLAFDHPAKVIVRDDYLREVVSAAARVSRLTKDLETVAPTTKLWPLIQAFQGMRGIKLVTAATLAAEVGDFARFPTPKKLMSFLGLVPRESSSGERTTKGSITKAGNSHVRRVLCEAAWNYRFQRGGGKTVEARRKHLAEPLREIAKNAEERLRQRYFHLVVVRKKEANKVNVAISRELVGFVWAMAREVAAKSEEQRKK